MALEVKKHILVPKHQKIQAKEAEELLIKYNIAPKQLPKILKKDPALEGLDIEKGDIIKITRKSPTAIKVNIYRVVV